MFCGQYFTKILTSQNQGCVCVILSQAWSDIQLEGDSLTGLSEILTSESEHAPSCIFSHLSPIFLS